MGETQKKEKKKIGLTTKIFIALLAGAVFGIILCYAVPSGHIKDDIIVEGVLYVVGQGFIKLMKMLVVPLVFCSLVCGSMSIGDTKKLGTVGARTLIFYLATTALAVTVALSVGNLINPGVGLDMSTIKTNAASVETMKATSLTDTLLNIIPDNPINSLASGEMLQIIVFALIIGVIIGVLVAIIRSAYDQQPERKKGLPLKILNGICKVYLTVIRGTPMMVQLLIMWFIVWASARSTDSNMLRCAILAFGINSGAYVAEIFRSGIMSIDKGQMEAGRSVGLTYAATMRYIIIPQAFKNVLPALGNELITLLKETSVVTVIGLRDLTKGAMIIQSKTYQAMVPYLAIAAIYLVIVMFLTWVMGKLERRLRQSDLR